MDRVRTSRGRTKLQIRPEKVDRRRPKRLFGDGTITDRGLRQK